MSTDRQKRPDPREIIAKAPPSKRADLSAELNRPEVQRALQKAEGGIDAELAAQLAPQLGNDALQELIKAGSETSTGSTNATTAGQEVEEGEEQEQEQEQEQDLETEVQAILPSFSGPSGAPGASPWAMGKFFGGDGDADEESGPAISGRWRPMPSLPEPEDLPLGGVDDPTPPAPSGEGTWLDEARRELGRAPWSRDLLGRGLRDPVALCRPGFEPEDLEEGLDTPFGRARTAIVFLATHAETPGVRRLAWTLAGSGSAMAPWEMGYSGATARALHGLSALLLGISNRADWEAVLEARLCVNARSVAEQAADRLEVGTLGAVALFTLVMGTEPGSDEAEGAMPAAHPAARDALALAACLSDIPQLEPWVAHDPVADDVDGTAAIDRILEAYTGELPGLHRLEPLYTRMNGLLDALGLAQLELAAAAFAAVAAGVPRPAALQAIRAGDAALVRVARRLVRVGRSLETEEDDDAITALSWEAVAVREGADLARAAALDALAAALAPRTVDPEDDAEMDAARELLLSARFEAARAHAPQELVPGIALREGRPDLAAAALDGDETTVGLSMRIGVALALGLPVAALGVRLQAAGEAAGLPFAVAEGAIAQSVDADDPFEPLRRAAAWLRAEGAGGALALLLGRWGELREGRPLYVA